MGKASGANSTAQRFGGVFGVAIATAIFAANGHLGTAASFTAGFRPALAVLAGLSLLGAMSALAVRSVRSRRRAPASVRREASAAASLDTSGVTETEAIGR